MGNRAYVVFENEEQTEFSPAIYLHWNGGPESIYAFLKVFDDYGCRKTDLAYASARFCQIVGNFFTGTLSCGLESVSKAKDLDKLVPGDNGLFVFAWIESEKAWRCRRMTGHYNGSDNLKIRWWDQGEVACEKDTALKSDYWNPKEGNDSILVTIHKRNDAAFKESQHHD